MKQAYRASILTFNQDPGIANNPQAWDWYADGLVITAQGKVEAVGNYAELKPRLDASIHVNDWRGKLLMPGFIDCHVHYAQLDVIASYGAQLLDWLNNYTFPAEDRFADKRHASQYAQMFLEECLRQGITTAAVYPTVHKESVDAFFEASQARGMRMICGKIMMDRNAPDYLCDTVASAEQESIELIEKWHGKDRLLYALTPRFAPTSTPEQLQMAGELYQAYEGLYVQSHVAENKAEVAWAKELFPTARSYLDVYQQYGLLGARAIYGHCIWLDEQDKQDLQRTQTSIAFCPTSNLFLGSGLFDLDGAQAAGVRVGLATDVGGGTSFSILQTLNESYKVLALQGSKLSAFRGFYLATLGGAQALHLEDRLGQIAPGFEADFVALDLAVTPMQMHRMAVVRSLDEQLFALMMMGNERNVAATVIAGEVAYQREL